MAISTGGVCPVILCGGSGKRLWPLSIDKHPKQFISLLSDKSLLQETASRMSCDIFDEPVIICNQSHRFIVAQQLKDTKKQTIILEPFAKNTAPAIALAAFYLYEQDCDNIMLVMPSDHLIKEANKFTQAIDNAIKYARDGQLVTFGIAPNGVAETGYGYIQKGAAIDGLKAHKVRSFSEKPSRETALEYIKSGDYLWNSGIFLFSAKTYLSELQRHSPLIYDICQEAYKSASCDSDYMRPDAEIFKICPHDSIDYAIMEKTKKAVMIEVDIGWSDIGSWQRIWQSENKDSLGNVVKSHASLIESKNCYIRSSQQKISIAGLENIAIIATDDNILVTSMGFSEKISEFSFYE